MTRKYEDGWQSPDWGDQTILPHDRRAARGQVDVSPDFQRLAKCLVQASIVCLIVTGVVVFFVLVYSKGEENAISITLRILVIPFTIAMCMLWFYVGTSWERAGPGKQVAIALITVPSLPIFLYFTFWALVYLVSGLFLLVMSIYALTSPGPDYTRAHLTGISNALDDINKKL